jgi:hypothetical protein
MNAEKNWMGRILETVMNGDAGMKGRMTAEIPAIFMSHNVRNIVL